MRIPVNDAEGQLAELVRRAGEGEDVFLVGQDKAVVKLQPVETVPVAASELAVRRQAVMDKVRASARGKATEGPDAARSQDFLYDEYGLPK